MTTRDKEKINILINEAKEWADENKDYLTGLDNDCEEVSVPCLTIEEVKRLLENLKLKLLKDDDCEEISIPCLVIEDVDRLIGNLEVKRLKEDEPC